MSGDSDPVSGHDVSVQWDPSDGSSRGSDGSPAVGLFPSGKGSDIYIACCDGSCTIPAAALSVYQLLSSAETSENIAASGIFIAAGEWDVCVYDPIRGRIILFGVGIVFCSGAVDCI